MAKGVPNVKSERQLLLDEYMDTLREADGVYVQLGKLQDKYAKLVKDAHGMRARLAACEVCD